MQRSASSLIVPALFGACVGVIVVLVLGGGRGIKVAFAMALLSAGAAAEAIQRFRMLGVQPQTPLHGATPVPLSLEHPYLQVRATITEAGRVTILIDGVAPDLSLGARRGFSLAGIEQKTGDASFDAQVRVIGNSLTSRSLLDGATRDVIKAALARFPGLTVNAGTVEWSGRPASTEDAARELLELASRLLSPDLLAGLEKSALTDRTPAMRLRALELLCGRFGGNPETHRIASLAVKDTDAAIRLRAALFLGPEGHDELATLAANEDLATEVRAEAVRNMALLPPERAGAIVRDALTDRRELVRMAAIVTVQRMRLSSCNGRLAILVRRAPAAQQLAIVEAAAATGDESAETPLLAALEDGPLEVKLAAIRALGRIGTIRSIGPLLELRGTQLLVGELGPPASAAVAAIQARLAGAGAGQLALAETAGGEVSFPGAERGSLSVPPTEPGGLSLRQDEVEGVRHKAAARRRTS